MLAINEEFYSIQGEGVNVGRPMYFIRLQGCGVGCHFCDTKHSWKKDDAKTDEADIIRRAVDVGTDWICITGGEPAEQDLSRLIDLASMEGLFIQLETSGIKHQDCFDRIRQITVSPKTLFSNVPLDPKMIEVANEIKCVVTQQSDIQHYVNLAKKSQAVKTFVPMSNSPPLAQMIFDNMPKSWKLQCQEHTVLKLR